jgi:hypothetical protein
MCNEVVAKWRRQGPKALNNGGWDVNGEPLEYPNGGGLNSGVYLFTDRQNITHFFKPNFLPPYDTPDKKKIILSYLQQEWDENTLSWKYAESNVEKALSLLRNLKQETAGDDDDENDDNED